MHLQIHGVESTYSDHLRRPPKLVDAFCPPASSGQNAKDAQDEGVKKGRMSDDQRHGHFLSSQTIQHGEEISTVAKVLFNPSS